MYLLYCKVTNLSRVGKILLRPPLPLSHRLTELASCGMRPLNSAACADGDDGWPSSKFAVAPGGFDLGLGH